MDSSYTFIVVGMVAAVACGGSGSSPTAPTSVATTTAIPAQPSTWKVNGWIGGFGVGGWVENATVRVGSTASATTNAGGYFELEVDQSGLLPVVIEASGFHKSESYLDVNFSKTTTISAYQLLLPNNNTAVFDMEFFDHVFRDSGTRGTRRWVTIPTVEIWTKKMKCLETMEEYDDKYCAKWEATATATPSVFESYIRSVVNTDIPDLTDDVLSGISITTKSHATGTVLELPSCGERQPSSISVAYMTPGSTNLKGYSRAWSCRYSTGEVRAGDIHMNQAYHAADLKVYQHEFAHLLGWRHPDGQEAVPRLSIMSPKPRTITSLDRSSGRVLYKYRAAGNMSPDKELSGNTINWPTWTRTFDFDAPNMHMGSEMGPTVMAPNPFTNNPTVPMGQGQFRGPLIEEVDY